MAARVGANIWTNTWKPRPSGFRPTDFAANPFGCPAQFSLFSARLPSAAPFFDGDGVVDWAIGGQPFGIKEVILILAVAERAVAAQSAGLSGPWIGEFMHGPHLATRV